MEKILKSISVEDSNVKELMEMDTIGMNLKAIREHLGLTQQQLADKLGFKQSSISGIENGNRGDIHVSTIRKYLEAMGCEVSFEATLPNMGKVKLDLSNSQSEEHRILSQKQNLPTHFDQQFLSQVTPVSKLEDLSKKQLLVKILEDANEMLVVTKRQHNEMISGGFKPGELTAVQASTGGFVEDFWETEEGIKVKKDITEANFEEFVRSYPIYGTPIKDEFDEESLNKLVRTCLRNVHYIARNDEIKGNFILNRYFGPNRHFDNITLQVIGDTYHMSVSKKDKALQDGFQDFSTLTSAITHISLLEDGYIDILK